MQPLKRDDTVFGIVLAYSLVLLFIAALMIKVDATSDDEDDQEIFGMLLVATLFAGPVSLVLFETGRKWYGCSNFSVRLLCAGDSHSRLLRDVLPLPGRRGRGAQSQRGGR